ncbi:MAG: efflux RND transporter periplasmic adaptor subunit [Pirellulales bacterium]
MKRLWILIILIAALGAGGYYLSTTRRGVPVDVAQVRTDTIRSYVEERGKTRLPDIVQITLPLQGRILPIELKEGEHVSAGQVVAHMDGADLETELTEARNTVERYDKNIEQVELAVQQADETVVASQSKFDFAEREFARINELFRRGASSESIRNEAEMRMIDGRVSLRKDELNRSMYAIGRRIMELMKETEVTKQAKLERDQKRMQIVSPASGVVLSRKVSNEQVLQAGTVLLEVGDLNQLEVEADLLTQDALTVSVDDPVEIEAESLGAKGLRGRVTRIFPQGFTKVSSLGVEQQRVRIVIGFEEGEIQQLLSQQRQVGVDYHVRVKIFTDQRDSTAVAPRGAFFRGSTGDWQVFAVRNRRARLVPVKLGIRNDYEVEVLEGLESGETVVLAPDSTLTDGQLVEPSS